MTEIAGGEAAPTTEAEKPVTEVTTETTTQEPLARDYEGEAAKGGWRPKADWTGDPDHWKDAKTWVENGDIHAKVKRIETDYAARFEKLSKQTQRTIDALAAQHAKEIAELTTERRTAIKGGNVDEVERLDKAIEVLKDAAPDKEPEESPKELQDQWIAKQDWWDVDEDMTAYAVGISQGILAKNPKITMADNLSQTETALRKRYPEKFGGEVKKTQANGHAPVDGGGAFPLTPKADPLQKLPAEARAMAREDMKKYPKMYPTAQSWIDKYDSKT